MHRKRPSGAKPSPELLSALRLHFNASGEAISKRIKYARTQNLLSQRDLGILIQKSSKAVQHWEAGDSLPAVRVLVELAKYLATDPVWLVTGIKCRLTEEFIENEARQNALSSTAIHIATYITSTPNLIGARMRAAREDNRFSLMQVGKHVGKSGQAVQHWEMGNSEANLEVLVEIAAFLRRDPFWLIFGLDVEVDPEFESDKLTMLRATPSEFAGEALLARHKPSITGHILPLLKGVERNALLTECYVDMVPEHDEKFVSYFAGSALTFAYKVESDRNSPEINKGDIVVIDPEVSAQDGALVLIRSQDWVELGWLKVKNGVAYLKSTNRSYTTERLGPFSRLERRDDLPLLQRRVATHVIGVATSITRKLS